MLIETENPQEFVVSFNASHLLYGEGMNEDLHGHNYVLTFTLQSKNNYPLNEGLKEALFNLSKLVHDKIIVAEESKSTIAEIIENSIKITLPDMSFYELPRKDCYLIPEVSSSAECLCKHAFEYVKSYLNEDWVKAIVIISEIYKQQEAIYQAFNQFQ